MEAGVIRRLNAPNGIKSRTPVEVTVQGQTATLRGIVSSEHDRVLAEQLVRLEPGIWEVNNELTLPAESPAENADRSPPAPAAAPNLPPPPSGKPGNPDKPASAAPAGKTSAAPLSSGSLRTPVSVSETPATKDSALSEPEFPPSPPASRGR